MEVTMKSFKWVLLFSLASILVISCGTTNNVFDAGLPPDQTANLTINPEWTIKAYNGIPVKLKKGWGGTGYRIPAGDTELLMDLSYKFGNVLYTARDVSFKFKYDAGENYFIFFHFVNAQGELMRTSISRGNYKTSLVVSKEDIKKVIFFENMAFRF
jgi:hypothetical protein